MEADLTSNGLLRDSLGRQRSFERKMRNSLKLTLPGGEPEEEEDCGESHIKFFLVNCQAKAMQGWQNVAGEQRRQWESLVGSQKRIHCQGEGRSWDLAFNFSK